MIIFDLIERLMLMRAEACGMYVCIYVLLMARNGDDGMCIAHVGGEGYVVRTVVQSDMFCAPRWWQRYVYVTPLDVPLGCDKSDVGTSSLCSTYMA